METKIDRYSPIFRGVRKRAMDSLSIGDEGISRIAYERDGIFEPIEALISRYSSRYIYFALPVCTGQYPNSICGGTSIKLHLHIETMNVLVPVRMIPMDLTVLMPCDRGP